MDNVQIVLLCIGIAVVAAAAAGIPLFFAGVSHRKKVAEAEIGSAEEQAKKVLNDAYKTAESRKKELLVEAREEIHQLRSEADRDIKERRGEVSRQERRIQQKEESLDRKLENAERKEEQIQSRLAAAEEKLAEAETIKKSQLEQLERISGLTVSQAKEQLLESLEGELTHEKALKIASFEQQLKDEAEEKARNILSLAITRCAADHVSEATVSVVNLPSDEMKGRIIGREGRNIRALETLTGVDLIIDDTPEAITLSCFDPVRREIARIALEKLIADGRIHPARIEETVEKVTKEIDQQIKAAGENAMFEVGIFGLHPELIKLIGRLKFRTSYGQNVYRHSIEVAQLAGLMAQELGLDVNFAKRAGLLHDIGKAVDREQEGTHIQIGADLAKKYKENAMIVNAIMAHHGDVEPKTIEAVLVQAADAISGARPGARRETGSNYVKRLEKLEEIASSFHGVEKSYAIQAGREVRVIVKPDQIDDAKAIFLAKDIAKKIENELEYPGQIKVNVIREFRSAEYAK